MTADGSGRHTGGGWLATLLVASTATAITAAVVAYRRWPAPPAAAPLPATVPLVAAPAIPIRTEAEVFRTRAAMLAIPPSDPRNRVAHPRELATWRFLRAYPGAPPRIPHGLSPEEYRTGTCRTCHERGGYSRRFAAYVPVTPHPEIGPCLQCHAGEEEVTGRRAPDLDPNTRCGQCHGPEGRVVLRTASELDWRTIPWVNPERPTTGRNPPVIPHDLQFRNNCLACHSGPAAVAVIRTDHPERADCRSCHLAGAASPEEAVFSRAAAGLEGPP